MLNFGKTVADSPLCAKYPAASRFPFLGALRGRAGVSAVYKCTRAPLAWHERALVSVHVRVRNHAFVSENDGEKECCEEMNERNDIYIRKSQNKVKRSGINLWRSVLILWRCAAHWSMHGKHCG